jgi:hypothetical protein
MIGAAPSAGDPLWLPDPGKQYGFNTGTWCDTSNTIQKSPVLVGGQNTVLLICYGQSLLGNHNTDGYASVSALNQQFNINDGGVYVCANPMLGGTYNLTPGGPFTPVSPSSYLVRLGDKLIADGYCARVIIANVSVGGTAIAYWAPGGIFNPRLTVVAKRLAQQGLVPANLYKTFILQHQGENHDAVTPAAYAASTQSAIATITGSPGFASAKAFVALASWFLGTTDTNIRTGQTNAVNGTSIFQGPDLDTLDGTNRYDNIHFNATGCAAAANMWATILEAH